MAAIETEETLDRAAARDNALAAIKAVQNQQQDMIKLSCEKKLELEDKKIELEATIEVLREEWDQLAAEDRDPDLAEAIRETFDELNAVLDELNVKIPQKDELDKCASREKLTQIMDQLQWELDECEDAVSVPRGDCGRKPPRESRHNWTGAGESVDTADIIVKVDPLHENDSHDVVDSIDSLDVPSKAADNVSQQYLSSMMHVLFITAYLPLHKSTRLVVGHAQRCLQQAGRR